MTPEQATALKHHCRLAVECVHPRFGSLRMGGLVSVVLTVNSGYEWIEAGFGGPVWHASIAPRSKSLAVQPERLRAIAEEVLTGVGDAAAGEWMELGEIAVHLRRRLSAAEAATVGPVVDVRGSWESQKRLRRMEKYLPPELCGVEE
jgi:hypothetical protein